MLNNPRRVAFFLPNSFTALNIACGFFSIINSFKQEFYIASMALVLGAIFDSVDGRVARMTNTQSAFGEQFDSISDVVTFGVAPAFLIYHRFLFDLGRFGMVSAFLFLLCGALRLARFNANINKVSGDFFQGLPIPGGALCIVGVTLLAKEFPELLDFKILIACYTLAISLMMISNIPFNSFKKSAWVKTHKKRVFFIMLILMVLTALHEEIMIFLIMASYISFSLVYYFINRETLNSMFEWESEFDEEHV